MGLRTIKKSEVLSPEVIAEQEKNMHRDVPEGIPMMNPVKAIENEDVTNSVKAEIDRLLEDLEPSTREILRNALSMLQKGVELDMVKSVLESALAQVEAQEQEWEKASMAIHSVLGIIDNSENASKRDEQQEAATNGQMTPEYIIDNGVKRIGEYQRQHSQDTRFLRLANDARQSFESGSDSLETILEELYQAYAEDPQNNQHYLDLVGSIRARMRALGNLQESKNFQNKELLRQQEELEARRTRLENNLHELMRNFQFRTNPDREIFKLFNLVLAEISGNGRQINESRLNTLSDALQNHYMFYDATYRSKRELWQATGKGEDSMRRYEDRRAVVDSVRLQVFNLEFNLKRIHEIQEEMAKNKNSH